MSCCITTGALESPDLLSPYSITTIALHIAIVLIITHLYIFTSLTHKSINQLITTGTTELTVDQYCVPNPTHRDGRQIPQAERDAVDEANTAEKERMHEILSQPQVGIGISKAQIETIETIQIGLRLSLEIEMLETLEI